MTWYFSQSYFYTDEKKPTAFKETNHDSVTHKKKNKKSFTKFKQLGV